MSYKIGKFPDLPSGQLLGKTFNGNLSYEEDRFLWFQWDPERVLNIQSLCGLSMKPDCELVVGNCVLAWWEEGWYRGHVKEVTDAQEAVVFFVDWGNTALVNSAHVKGMSVELMAEPPLAVQCRFDSLEPNQVNTEKTLKFIKFADGLFTVTSGSNLRTDEVRSEVEKILAKLREFRTRIEEGVEKFQLERKQRAEKRKEIILREMKGILLKLSESDNLVQKDLKGDVLDCLRNMTKLNKEIENIINRLKSGENVETDFARLKMKYESLDLTKFCLSLDIGVAVQPAAIASAFEVLSNSVHLKSPVVSPTFFTLVNPASSDEMPSDNPKFFTIRLDLCCPGVPNYDEMMLSFLLQRLQLQVFMKHGMENLSKLEDVSVAAKRRNKEVEVRENGKVLFIKLKRRGGPKMEIHLKTLGSHVKNSPLILQCDASRPQGNASIDDTALNFNNSDLEGLDESDLVSLDLTNRIRMNANPKVSKSPMMSPLKEVYSEVNETTPFSPRSEGVVSTMRVAELSKLTSQASASLSPVRDESILAPSRSSGMSFDDVQKSLSSVEVEPVKNKYVYNGEPSKHNKSVSFAVGKSSPELSESRIAEACAETLPLKREESIYDPHLMLNASKAPGAETIVNCWLSSRNEDTDGVEANDNWDKVDKTLDNIFNITTRDDVVDEAGNDDTLEDPHIMLNASKAPGEKTIAECWFEEWSPEEENSPKKVNRSLLPEMNSRFWDDDDDQNDNAMDDPHIMLNASKAPGNYTIAHCWASDETTRDAPEQASFQESRLKASEPSQNLRSPADGAPFDFSRCNFDVEEVLEAQRRTRSSTLGFKAPVDITFVEHLKLVLVSEAQLDRIGVYKGEHFRFKCWLDHPEEDRGTSFQGPTSLLATRDGHVVIIEKTKLHILNREFVKQISIFGTYHGLAEDRSIGGFWTIVEKGKLTIARHFKIGPKIELLRDIELVKYSRDVNYDSTRAPKCRFLHCFKDSIFVTDMRLNKIYEVNVKSEEKKTFGYGLDEAKLKSPAGILVDQVGNVLVGDHENDRLCVFDNSGKFIRAVKLDEKKAGPCGVVHFGDAVLVACMGRMENGVIVRYPEAGQPLEK